MAAIKTENKKTEDTAKAQPTNTDSSAPQLPDNFEIRFSKFVANQLKGELTREGIAVAPLRPINVQEVSSWMQVPKILAELQNGGGSGIRLTFPAPPSGTKGAEAIRNEQRAIRAFLQENHDKPLSAIAAELANNISSCALFAKFTTGAFKKITAESWLKSLQITSESTASLAVADVIDATGIKQQVTNDATNLRDQMVNLISEGGALQRATIITVPDGEREALKATLQAWYNAQIDPKVNISKVTVWVGVPADSITFGREAREAKVAECRNVKKISLSDLLGITAGEDSKDVDAEKEPAAPKVDVGEELAPIDLAVSGGSLQTPERAGRVSAALKGVARAGRFAGKMLDITPPKAAPNAGVKPASEPALEGTVDVPPVKRNVRNLFGLTGRPVAATAPEVAAEGTESGSVEHDATEPQLTASGQDSENQSDTPSQQTIDDLAPVGIAEQKVETAGPSIGSSEPEPQVEAVVESAGGPRQPVCTSGS